MEYSKKSFINASPEYLKLREYVAERPHGSLLTYSQVELDTGIKMDGKGIGKLRRAILANKREYIVRMGIGYELAKVDSAIKVVDVGIDRIGNAFVRAERRVNNVEENFMPDLSEDDQSNLLFKKSMIGAINNTIQNSKKIYGKKNNQLALQKPVI